MAFGNNNAAPQDLGFSFSTATAPRMSDRSDLPEGQYLVKLTAIELRETQTGGRGLNAEMTVQGGNFDGRKVFEFINVVNSSQVAQDRGRAFLASLCDGVGFVGDLRNPQQLLTGKPFIVTMKQRKESDGSMRARIVKVEATGGGITGVATTAAPVAPVAQGGFVAPAAIAAAPVAHVGSPVPVAGAAAPWGAPAQAAA